MKEQRKPRYVTGPFSRSLDSLVSGDLVNIRLHRNCESVPSHYHCVYEGQINTNFKTYYGNTNIDFNSKQNKKGFEFLNLTDFIENNKKDKIESIIILKGSNPDAYFYFVDSRLCFQENIGLEDERMGRGHNFVIRNCTIKENPELYKKKLKLLDIGKKLYDRYVHPPNRIGPKGKMVVSTLFGFPDFVGITKY